MPDMLDTIVAHRRAEYQKKGASFGYDIPKQRSRPLVPFLERPGAILEIKRASPSKGSIAPDLDPVLLAGVYARAGAKQISILTEENYFKGSLDDLIAIAKAYPDISLLRKDFILYEDELEISYRAGADAVLLIARLLDTDFLCKLTSRCLDLGMKPLIEVREQSDIPKLVAAGKRGPVLAGVNARDLATFKIDSLVPAQMRSFLPCPAVFESGLSTLGACAYARRLGYEGVLIGEAVAKNPEKAQGLVAAFVQARPDWTGQFWREIGRRVNAVQSSARARPLIKICGLTNSEDALEASRLGADLLGFVFAPSPRQTTAQKVREIYNQLSQEYKIKPEECASATQGSCCGTPPPSRYKPLLIGVITDLDSVQTHEAFSLINEGVLDAIQFHGDCSIETLALFDTTFAPSACGRFFVQRLGSDADLAQLELLCAQGEPRILVDTKIEQVKGGTGLTIQDTLLEKLSQVPGLWLAGGLNPTNIRSYIDRFSPELIDASSGLELKPGKKDHTKLKAFFKEIFDEC